MIRSASRTLVAVFLLTTALHAEETAPLDPYVSNETAIPGVIADGTPAEPAPQPAPLKFKVKSTVTRRMEVVEAPEFSDLPPVKGTITTTVQLVEDPGLPDPPPPLPALPVDDPAVAARMKEVREDYQESRIAFVSATVYGHARTYLRCYTGGKAGKEIGVWSNLDFNHFSGFSSYQVKGRDGEVRQYAFLMGLGNETEVAGGSRAKNGKTAAATEIPVFPRLPDLATGGPTFVVTEGDTGDKESVELIEGMHDLYRVEGARMEAAYHARIKAYDERKAYLQANPPKPSDVTTWISPPRRIAPPVGNTRSKP